MKQAWKTFTLTVKRQAVRDMKALVAQGHSVSRARKTIGDGLNVTPNTIYNWERKLTGKSTQTKGLKTISTVATKSRVNANIGNNGIARPHITSVNLHVPGKGNITLDHELLSNISRLAGFVS